VGCYPGTSNTVLGMNKYIIKKTIIAKNIKQALKFEKKAEVAEIYQDYNYIPESKTKMGFNKEKL